MTQSGNKIAAVSAAKAYLLAGNATATFQNPITGNRFTYKITKGKKPGAPHFVKVLTGQDNEGSFTYLGCIFDGTIFRVTAKSRISPDAPSARAFVWVWIRLITGQDISPIEIWHSGQCGRCGRKLTVPESILTGLGPVCAGL